MSGPHVFGDDRVGLWVASKPTAQQLTDKLTHILPRLRGAVPNLTDIFLPPEGTPANRKQVLDAKFFCSMYYPPPHGKGAVEYADAAVAAHTKQGGGSLELNIEGVPDADLAKYVTDAVARVRTKKPNLALRINVVPFKGKFLPSLRWWLDNPNVWLIGQAYGGNMDIHYAADEVFDDLFDVIASRASIMYPVMCSYVPGRPRQVTLPVIRNRGSLYIDDLLFDAELL